MSVKRYNNWCCTTHGHSMSESPVGLYVLASDHDAEVERLTHELADMRTMAFDNRDSAVRLANELGEREREVERVRGLLREALPAVASYVRKNERAQRAAERRDDVIMVDKHATMVSHYGRIKSDIDAALKENDSE